MITAHKNIRAAFSLASTLALFATAHCGGPVATPEAEPTNGDQAQLTVQSAAAQQYFSAAGNNCQAEQAALDKALSDLSNNPMGSLDGFNAAIQAFMKCVSSHSDGNLPPVPGQSCTAEVVNGQLKTSGDCSQCKVVQSGGSVSVSCSSGGDGTGSLPPPSDGSGSGGVGCTVFNDNGKITTSGDCSHCTVGADGSLSCVSSN